MNNIGRKIKELAKQSVVVRTLYSRITGGKSWFALLKLAPEDRYLDFDIKLDFDFHRGRNYLYSKLYYNERSNQDFDESRVICFHPIKRRVYERVRIQLPRAVQKSGSISIRIDGVPHGEGAFSVKNVGPIPGSDDSRLSRWADLRANRQTVRDKVLASEKKGEGSLSHYPESLSLELTPRCNLTCPHCSSHGTPDLHKHHNGCHEISIEQLERIAHETFPHITALSLVGRGEPTMVSHEVWERLSELVKEYGVKISCVTNGHFIKQRLTEALIPYVDEICISMDGYSQEVHGVNRSGSSLKMVMQQIEYFHELRQRASLARRPKLSIYWTLMTNNIHELPSFIRDSARYDPDYFAIRHLVVFHDKDRHKSLLGQPDKVNFYLKEAYEELNRRGIEYEAPPLMEEETNTRELSNTIIARECASGEAGLTNSFESLPDAYLAERCTWMYRTGIIGCNGEVTTCGKHYGELVGRLNDETPFYAIWNGFAMQSLRNTFNTPDMWRQCRECWLRELRWHAQRHEKGLAETVRARKAIYTQASWDYRAYSKL